MQAGAGLNIAVMGAYLGVERGKIDSPEGMRKALIVQVDRPIETVKRLLVA